MIAKGPRKSRVLFGSKNLGSSLIARINVNLGSSMIARVHVNRRRDNVRIVRSQQARKHAVARPGEDFLRRVEIKTTSPERERASEGCNFNASAPLRVGQQPANRPRQHPAAASSARCAGLDSPCP